MSQSNPKKIVDVYNKIWLATHDKNIPMRVVYRMRGLMGEATEEFIEKYVYGIP